MNLFLLSEEYVLYSNLSAQEALARLSHVIQPYQWLKFSPSEAPYEGDIMDNHFSIRRVIHYRNSFRPVIEGRIEVHEMGSAIHIRMRLASAAAIIYSLTILFILCFASACLFEYFSQNEINWNGIVVVGFVGIGSYVICLHGFAREMLISKRFLVQVFSEEEKGKEE
jgi:hypothetical protein